MFHNLSPFVQSLLKPLAYWIARRTSANTVTYTGLATLPATLILMALGFKVWALSTYLFSSLFCDVLDGPVARAREKLKFHDDKVWGGFVDAMKDKICQCSVIFTLVIMLPIQSTIEHIIFYILSATLIIYEIIVGAIRIHTYVEEKKNRKPTTKTPSKTNSTEDGKDKTGWQVAGISFAMLAIMSTTPQGHWGLYVADILLIISFYYGILSLAEKLRQTGTLTR